MDPIIVLGGETDFFRFVNHIPSISGDNTSFAPPDVPVATKDQANNPAFQAQQVVIWRHIVANELQNLQIIDSDIQTEIVIAQSHGARISFDAVVEATDTLTANMKKDDEKLEGGIKAGISTQLDAIRDERVKNRVRTNLNLLRGTRNIAYRNINAHIPLRDAWQILSNHTTPPTAPSPKSPGGSLC